MIKIQICSQYCFSKLVQKKNLSRESMKDKCGLPNADFGIRDVRCWMIVAGYWILDTG
jgi:hypothetical protein